MVLGIDRLHPADPEGVKAPKEPWRRNSLLGHFPPPPWPFGHLHRGGMPGGGGGPPVEHGASLPRGAWRMRQRRGPRGCGPGSGARKCRRPRHTDGRAGPARTPQDVGKRVFTKSANAGKRQQKAYIPSLKASLSRDASLHLRSMKTVRVGHARGILGDSASS
jgi:hypothetical protein